MIEVAFAADFTYNAYGGFVQGSQRGSNGSVDDIHFTVPVSMPDSSTAYGMVDWGFGGSSSLELVPQSGTITSNGGDQREILGTLMHHNEPINSGSSLEKVDIVWHLNLQSNTAGVNDFNRTWSFELHNWETPNNAYPCPRDTVGIIRNLDDTNPIGAGFPYLGDGLDNGTCDDAHDFVDYPDQNYSWVDGGTVYRIEVTGFYDALNNLKQTFWAEEDGSTSGTVQFSITEVGPANVNIGDRIWIDSNNDGIQDANETAGVPNVKVELFYDANDTVADTVYSDINGTYELFNVNTINESTGQPIDYYIKFTLPIAAGLTEFSPKYANGAAIPLENADDSDVDASGYTDPFIVDANTTSIDAGVRCGSIGNLVWIDKNQNGLQDPGEPGIEGVQVNLYKSGDLNRTIASSPLGLYGFMPLPSGEYVVEFVLPSGYRFSPYRIGNGSNEATDSDANVTDGKTRLITIDLNSSSSCHVDYYDAGIFQELNITKEVNATIAAFGDLIGYTITVTNHSERNATDVNVTDFLPVGVTYINDTPSQGSFDSMTGLWEVGFLAAEGGSATLHITVEVTGSTGVIENNASVVSEQNSIGIWDDANFTIISPAIAIEKTTNGVDASSAPGPIVTTGSTVTWEYNVTNTGDANLINIIVADDPAQTISCPYTTLAPGESMECNATGIAVAGQYENNATVTAISPTGGTVSDSDMSFYFGQDPSIDIEKMTNGVDASGTPGPVILTGSTVTWEYNITNTGDVNLSNIAVNDNPAQTISCPKNWLAPGKSMTCEANGTAVAGQYENNATATANTPVGTPVSDSDMSYYFGQDPSIDIEKMTNGVDASGTPGPVILTGSTVTWEYTVTNTGDVNLSNIVVNDDPEGSITCPKNWLAPDESMVCEKNGTAITGQYENNATATANTPVGTPVSDSDMSYYLAEAPSIDIEKTTNGWDASSAPGPIIAAGSTVTWEYNITNTGDVNLSNIVVNDDPEGSITCEKNWLAPDESMVCEKNGTAITGQYENNATVTASSPEGTQVSDSDMNYYTGEERVELLGDYVWYDDNYNGIQDEEEEGVEGLIVTLLDANGTEINTTTTDANGRYQFEVEPGTYSIRFSGLPENYIFTKQNVGDDTTDSDADNSGMISSINIGLGEVDNTLDTGIYCTCFDEAKSDSSPALNQISAALMILMTLGLGLFFVRREELKQR